MPEVGWRWGCGGKKGVWIVKLGAWEVKLRGVNSSRDCCSE
jgi:hypothetical protein